MITAGVDAGNKFTKALLLKDDKILSYAMKASGFDQKKAAEDAFNQALFAAGITPEEVDNILATGDGQGEVGFAHGTVTDVSAAARGVLKIFPSVRTVVDVGEEVVKAIKLDQEGRVTDFAINDKCAAGAGSFLESMSRVLDVQLEEMGLLALSAEKSVPMNAQCAVFAESEVISLIHARVPKPEIAKSIHEAMARRISSMVRRIDLQKEMAMIGGVAKNKGFVAALEEDLDVKILVDDEKPEYLCALGAALIAAEKQNNDTPKTEA